MKKILLIVLTISTIQISFAQTAADYYLPLCVGNYLKFHTPDVPGGWAARNTFNSIVQSDIINNEIYYLQKGYEVMDNNQSTEVFQCLWLREDLSGNIIIGAYDTTNSGMLESATIVPTGSMLFSNHTLKLGYSQTSLIGDGETSTDTVISVSASVETYTNCIQIRTISKVNGKVERIDDGYYAYHVGKVKQERLYPANEVHVDNLVDFAATNCTSTGIDDVFDNENEFGIYPNPAADIITFNIRNTNNETLKLEIYTDLGELVRSETLKQNNRQINIGDLCNGIYVVALKSKDISKKQKLVIQR